MAFIKQVIKYKRRDIPKEQVVITPKEPQPVIDAAEEMVVEKPKPKKNNSKKSKKNEREG